MNFDKVFHNTCSSFLLNYDNNKILANVSPATPIDKNNNTQ